MNGDTDLTLERYSSLKEKIKVYMSDQVGKKNQHKIILRKRKDILNHAQKRGDAIQH